jgi:hypothetical protein
MVKRKRKMTMTNNGRKSTTQKTKDWASRSPLKTRGEMEGTSPCSSNVTLAINPIINHERGKHSNGHRGEKMAAVRVVS